MPRLPLLLATSLLLPFAAHAAEPGAWPQWRGPDRDGRSAETGLLATWDGAPPLLWTATDLGRAYASVSVADGFAYTMGNFPDGQAVLAIKEGGERAWRTNISDEPPQHGHEGARCTPSIDEERLYVIGSAGSICCLKRETGELLWRRGFEEWGGKMMSGWGFSESPLVDGPWVLCTPGSRDALIVALDKLTGKEVWRTRTPPSIYTTGKEGAGYSSIVISNGAGVKQYVQLVGCGVVGVRAENGGLLWHYGKVANRTANIPTPIVSGNLIFCSTGYRTGSALLELEAANNGVTAKERYFLEASTLQNHHGGLVLVDGRVYGGHGHNEGLPICVELESGKVVWGGDARGPGSGSAAVTFADGNLIFRYQSGEVALIGATPDGYQLKGTFMPAQQKGKSWAHPVVAGGKLYLREQDVLMCYDISAK